MAFFCNVFSTFSARRIRLPHSTISLFVLIERTLFKINRLARRGGVTDCGLIDDRNFVVSLLSLIPHLYRESITRLTRSLLEETILQRYGLIYGTSKWYRASRHSRREKGPPLPHRSPQNFYSSNDDFSPTSYDVTSRHASRAIKCTRRALNA